MTLILFAAAMLLLGPDDAAPDLAGRFGFDPLEIYKVKKAAHNLRIADVDGDGKLDIALFNGESNRIELFLQPGKESPPATDVETLERNELGNRGILRNGRVPVSHRVATFDIAELTGDKFPDIVYFGEPKDLVILPGRGGGEFGPAISQRAPEGLARGHSLATGDFNSDGRTDVTLLAEGALLLYLQEADGRLSTPTRVSHSVRGPMLLLRTDLNGDQRDDLILSVDDEEYGACVFLQDAGGRLGALRRIRMPRVTSVTVAPRPGGDDIFCVEQTSGRLKQLRWQTPEKATDSAGLTLLYSYPTTSKSRRRPMDLGDLTGDGQPDIVAADPDAAQLVLFKSSAAGFEPPVSFPGLLKTLDVRIGDVDGDGKPDVLSVSREEKMLGVSHFADGRLTFPTPLATRGAPIAVACGTLKAGDPECYIIYAATESKTAEPDGDAKKRGADKVTSIHIQPIGATAPARSFVIDAPDEDPSGLRIADINQDGLNDLLMFVPFAPLRAWLQQPDGQFTPLAGAAAREGLVKESALEDFALADVTGDGKPEVLLAQKNLARALVVKGGQWTVVDQYNPESADAQIKGLAAIERSSPHPTLLMYDRKTGQALVLEPREDHTYAVTRKLPIGTFETTAMVGETNGAAILADPEKLAVIRPHEPAPTLIEQQAFESEIRGVRIADSTVGDLNADGVRDVVLIDMRRAFLQILTTARDGDLVDVMNFQVFQGKRFSGDPDQVGEPREVLVGDVNADGADDIALLVHDRLIVYPSQR